MGLLGCRKTRDTSFSTDEGRSRRVWAGRDGPEQGKAVGLSPVTTR